MCRDLGVAGLTFNGYRTGTPGRGGRTMCGEVDLGGRTNHTKGGGPYVESENTYERFIYTAIPPVPARFSNARQSIRCGATIATSGNYSVVVILRKT